MRDELSTQLAAGRTLVLAGMPQFVQKVLSSANVAMYVRTPHAATDEREAGRLAISCYVTLAVAYAMNEDGHNVVIDLAAECIERGRACLEKTPNNLMDGWLCLTSAYIDHLRRNFNSSIDEADRAYDKLLMTGRPDLAVIARLYRAWVTYNTMPAQAENLRCVVEGILAVLDAKVHTEPHQLPPVPYVPFAVAGHVLLARMHARMDNSRASTACAERAFELGANIRVLDQPLRDRLEQLLNAGSSDRANSRFAALPLPPLLQLW